MNDEFLKKIIPDIDYEKEINKLINQLNRYDPIDLFSKLHFCSIFLRTNIVKENNEEPFIYDNALTVLYSFYMTHSVIIGKKRISFKKLKEIAMNVTRCGRYKVKVNDDEFNAIRLSQSFSTEILDAFLPYEIDNFPGFQEGLLKKYFNLSKDETTGKLNEYYYNSYKYNILDGIELKIEEYISGFDNYCNYDNFIITDNKLLEVCEKLCVNVGGLDSSLFSFSNPNAAINLSRKLFLRINNKVYCFVPKHVSTKFFKCLERLITDKNDKIIWNENKAIYTESSVNNVFEEYLPGCLIQSNNYFYDEKRRIENDLIIEYKNNVFIIEIKGGRVNPDPIENNEENLKSSYKDLVEKGISQCNILKSKIKKEKELSIYDEHNVLKHKYDFKNIYNIIDLVVTFDELGSYSPGYSIRKEKSNKDDPVIINFYDLYVVLDYLSNPVLIIKYFNERKGINRKKTIINDELIYLSIFTKDTLNINNYINNYFEKKFNVFFDTESYISIIEQYYSVMNFKKNKPTFNFHPVIDQILKINFIEVKSEVIYAIMCIMNLSIDKLNDISSDCLLGTLKLYKSSLATKSEIIGIVFSTCSQVYFSITNKGFKSNKDINKIIIFEFLNGKCEYKIFNR